MFIQIAKNNVKYMQYCKKAYHVSKFNEKMLMRKKENVKEYFQTNELLERFENLSNFYIDHKNILTKISPKWNKRLETLRAYIDSVPKESKNVNIRYYKKEFFKIFNISNVKMDNEQKAILKKIIKFEELEKINEDVLKYIDIPYNIENADDVLFDILKKIMNLKLT